MVAAVLIENNIVGNAQPVHIGGVAVAPLKGVALAQPGVGAKGAGQQKLLQYLVAFFAQIFRLAGKTEPLTRIAVHVNKLIGLHVGNVQQLA